MSLLPDKFPKKDMFKRKVIKGFVLKKESDTFRATHWMPLFDEEDLSEAHHVTPYQIYRLFYDQYEKEHMILNDISQPSYPFLSHKGRYVILEKIMYEE